VSAFDDVLNCRHGRDARESRERGEIVRCGRRSVSRIEGTIIGLETTSKGVPRDTWPAVYVA
jgi:hypothetical protein